MNSLAVTCAQLGVLAYGLCRLGYFGDQKIKLKRSKDIHYVDLFQMNYLFWDFYSYTIVDDSEVVMRNTPQFIRRDKCGVSVFPVKLESD